MGIRATGLVDHSDLVCESAKPILLGARLILDNDDDTLEIYDHASGPEYGTMIVYLDKDVPFMMFDKLDVFRCNLGLYANLTNGGKYIVYYDV